MPDYMFLLESRLLPEQRAALLRVQELSLLRWATTVSDGRNGARPDYRRVAARFDFTVEGNPSKIAAS